MIEISALKAYILGAFDLSARTMTVSLVALVCVGVVWSGGRGPASLYEPVLQSAQPSANASGETERARKDPNKGSDAPRNRKQRLADVLSRLSQLCDSDVDWEWTPLGKVRPALPVDIEPLREFYDDPEVEEALIELLKGPETLVVGHILIRDAIKRLNCAAIRQPYGFEAKCGGLTVRVKIAEGPINMKSIEYPNIRRERPHLIEFVPKQLKERSIAARRQRPVADGWTNGAESWLEKQLTSEKTTKEQLDAKLEAAFTDLLEAGVRWSAYSSGAAAPLIFKDWKALDTIQSGGRNSVDRLLLLLDQDESCVLAHILLTRLHADHDIVEFWHGPPFDGVYLQELNYNGLTVEIRGFEVKDWVVTYPRFDVEKHAVRHYWHSLCEKRVWSPLRTLSD